MSSKFSYIFVWLFALIALSVVIILFANGTIQTKWEEWFGGPSDRAESPIVLVPNEPTPQVSPVPVETPAPVPVATPETGKESQPPFTSYTGRSSAEVGDDLPGTGPEHWVFAGVFGVLIAGVAVVLRRQRLQTELKAAVSSIHIQE